MAILLAFGTGVKTFAASGYVFSVMAGGQAGKADGIGSTIQFNHPTGLAVDSSGTIYVADMREADACYHGYPLLPGDPLWAAVLQRWGSTHG